LVQLFLVSDKKRRARHWGDPYVSRAGDYDAINGFREILRINFGAKVDSGCRKNVRDSPGITAKIYEDHRAFGAAFLSEICDLEEAIVGDCDCERRRCDDLAFESARKNKARIQKNEGNQP
jgi:hypothetical protein